MATLHKKIFPITKERYFRFIKGRIDTTKLSMEMLKNSYTQPSIPFSMDRTDTVTCVVGNGIPKSGTYFINRIIEYLGQWKDTGNHINPTNWTSKKGDEVYVHPSATLKKLQNGQFIAAHMPWSRGTEKVIGHPTAQRRILHLLMYRDPRDTFISFMNYVTYPSEKQEMHMDIKKFKNFMLEKFKNDDERLAYIIEWRRNYDFLGYKPWLKSAQCHAIKFEELSNDFILLKNNVIGNVLKGILDYLEVDQNTIDPVHFYKNVFNKGTTASGIEDKIGQYKRIFKDEHYALLDNEKFKKVLDGFGYQWTEK